MPDFPKKLNKKQKERFLEEIPISLLDISIIKNYNYFGKTLNYVIQGLMCKDCKKSYDTCECDYCDDCLSTRCVCDINSYEELVKYIIDYLYLNFSYSEIIQFTNHLTRVSKILYDKDRNNAYLYIMNVNKTYFNTYYLRNPKKSIRKKKQ